MSFPGMLIVVLYFAIALHWIDRILYFARTGKGGVNDPLFLHRNKAKDRQPEKTEKRTTIDILDRKK